MFFAVCYDIILRVPLTTGGSLMLQTDGAPRRNGGKYIVKKLMLGNEAIARGLYEAGVGLVSSYPGTPSTEITEFAAKYDEI